MKKKNARKKSVRQVPQAVSVVVAVPAGSVALRLQLHCEYTLIGFYSLQPTPGDLNPPAAFALVELHDPHNSVSRYATYQVADVQGGLCMLPHTYGETELSDAHEDFWRRTGRGFHTSATKAKTKAPAERQAWNAKILSLAHAQEQAAKKAPAAAPPTTPTKKEKRR